MTPGHMHGYASSRSCNGRIEYVLSADPGAQPTGGRYCTGNFDIESMTPAPQRWDQDSLESMGDLQLAAHDFDLGDPNQPGQIRQFEVSLTDGPEYDADIDRRPATTSTVSGSSCTTGPVHQRRFAWTSCS